MGLFDALKNAVSEKQCSICGGEAGHVFAKKLEDGYLCKECIGKLSPWFSDRRSSTVAQIEEQLAYREANKEKVAGFNVTKTLNGKYKVLLDEDAGNFIVTSSSKWRESNPDVIPFADVTGCTYEIKESKTEIQPPESGQPGQPGQPPQGAGMAKNRPSTIPDKGSTSMQGRPQGMPPMPPQEPRYEYEYDFYITINVNNPYFDEIQFQVNEDNIEEKDSAEYNTALTLCEDIKTALTQVREDTRAAAAAAAAPKQAVTCPNCGATTFPDANGRCEYCGGALGA